MLALGLFALGLFALGLFIGYAITKLLFDRRIKEWTILLNEYIERKPGELQAPDMVDITAPEWLEVIYDGKTLWVNVDGICRLRVCRVKNPAIIDIASQIPAHNDLSEAEIERLRIAIRDNYIQS